ncbi:MAG TPA: M42 family metallopeptidase [Ktedonobacterales bacterium]
MPSTTKTKNGAKNGRLTQTQTPTGINVALLKRLTETPGVSGREEMLRAVVIEELKPLVDKIKVDALGNVIATKKGSSDKRVMLAAHMDQIGFMARYIDDRGFIRLQPLGGFDARVLVAQRVIVHARDGVLRGALVPAAKPIHMLRGEKPEAAKLEELYVDLGLPAEQVKAHVRQGDPITLDRPLQEAGECAISQAMDDRAGVWTMIEALRRLGKHEATIVAVATVQEEVGLRGATTSSFQVEPDVSIAIDVTLAMDTPGMPDSDTVTKLGDGVAIKVYDGSFIPNYKLVDHMRDIAEKHEIRHQMEVLPAGGTDAGAMQRTRGGSAAITVSIPTRYIHTVNEMVNLHDLDAAATLLARYLEDAHNGDYSL